MRVSGRNPSLAPTGSAFRRALRSQGAPHRVEGSRGAPLCVDAAPPSLYEGGGCSNPRPLGSPPPATAHTRWGALVKDLRNPDEEEKQQFGAVSKKKKKGKKK